MIAASPGKRLGVLDFFGFENAKQNHFQQFVVNYCNERMHQAFLQTVIKGQQERCTSEGLDWCPVDFFDNDIICDLLDKSSHGMVCLLDEPQVKDNETYLLRVRQCCSGHPNYLGVDNSSTRQCFL